MKKLPLFFFFFFFAFSTQKQVADDAKSFSRYSTPYHIYAIGKWDANHMIFTLVDANNTYFTVKGNYNTSLKKGDIYHLN